MYTTRFAFTELFLNCFLFVNHIKCCNLVPRLNDFGKLLFHETVYVVVAFHVTDSLVKNTSLLHLACCCLVLSFTINCNITETEKDPTATWTQVSYSYFSGNFRSFIIFKQLEIEILSFPSNGSRIPGFSIFSVISSQRQWRRFFTVCVVTMKRNIDTFTTGL